MKLGVILPIGNLNSYGYQYNGQAIIDNLAAFADELIVVSSTRHNPKELRGKNVTYINEPSTWFEQAEGKDVFTYSTLTKNLKRALETARANGCDVVMQIHINQFVSETVSPKLREAAEALFASGELYGWEYKKYQLGDWMFNADVRVPWMLNLSVPNPFEYDSDCIVNAETGETIRIQSGDFSANNDVALTDVMLLYPIQDAVDLFMFTQVENLKLAGNAPADIPAFEEKKWRDYMQYKINAKARSAETPGATGEILMKNAPKDSACYYFQRDYTYFKRTPWAKAARFIKRKLTR